MRQVNRSDPSQARARNDNDYFLRCLHYFTTSKKLYAHRESCERMNDCAVVLLTDSDRWLSFANYSRRERLPFVVYADLECILEKENGETLVSRRYAYHRHRVFSVGYYLHCAHDTTASAYRYRRNENCVSWFVHELNALTHRAKAPLSASEDMPALALDEERRFRNATSCHVCRKPFEREDRRVRDHCQVTGSDRGPAHSSCNLNYRDSHVVLVFFHNLWGYDAHFIIRDIANGIAGNVEILPIMKERYKLVTKNVAETSSDERKGSKCVKLRFVDSYRFLGAGLEQLASLLDRDKLRIARAEFPVLSAEDFELITGKGVFPYEYLDSVDKLRRSCRRARPSTVR